MMREGAAQDPAQSTRINVQELCDPRGWPFGSSTPGYLLTTWVLSWTVTHSGSIRFGEAAVPGPKTPKDCVAEGSVRWVQANVTGACNIECVLEMQADISLLTEMRCTGKALGKQCKSRNLVCTGRDSDLERLAAVVYRVWPESK